MGKKDPRVDAYISEAAEFAQPILKHVRKLVHAGCPEVEETLKWGFPHFVHEGILCCMAAFKKHCAFAFWKGELLGAKPRAGERAAPAMGQFGRIEAISDLPAERSLLRLVKRAAALNEKAANAPRRSAPRTRPKVKPPGYFMEALRRNKKALTAFEGFSDSHRREYVEWVEEAKRDETRQRRLATTVEWLAEGKPRNWKYVKR